MPALWTASRCSVNNQNDKAVLPAVQLVDGVMQQTHYEQVVVDDDQERCRDAAYGGRAGRYVPKVIHVSGTNFTKGRHGTVVAGHYINRRYVLSCYAGLWVAGVWSSIPKGIALDSSCMAQMSIASARNGLMRDCAKGTASRIFSEVAQGSTRLLWMPFLVFVPGRLALVPALRTSLPRRRAPCRPPM